MKTYLARVWTLALAATMTALWPAAAADRTWTGGAGDDFWSSPANWGGNALSAGDGVRFGGSTRTSPNNDFPPGTVFSSIQFLNPAGAFTLGGNSIALNGNIGDDQALVPQTIQFPIALSLTPTISVVQDGLLTLGGVLSGSGTITKTGEGQLTLGAVNTFSGPISIQGGTVAVSADGNLGAVPGSATPGSLQINQGTLRGTATFTLSANRGIALGPDGGAIRVNSGTTLSYGGIIANDGGTGGLTKSAFGGLTLSGANTYVGPTVIENGTLTLDFTQASAPANNVISSSSALTLGGGTAGLGAASFDALVMNGRSGTANSQTFNGTTITTGPAIIRANSGSGGSANINLGALTDEPGGILVVVPPTQNGGVGAISTTTANTHGILGGWATIGSGTVYRNITMGTEWASVNGSGNIVPYTGYTIFNTGDMLHTIGDASKNIRIDGTSTGDAVVNTPDANTVTDINTLNLSATRPFSVVIGNGNTLRLGRYGSIFKSDFANNITWALGSGTTGGGNGVQDSGTLTAGGTDDMPGEIIFYMNNNASQSQGSLNVEAKITDNGSGRVTVIKAGPASMKLRGHNTFSGGLYVLQGRLQLAGGEIGTANPDGPGTGPIHVYPGAYLFPSGTGSILTNDFFISGLGTDQEQVGAVRFGNGWSISGTVTLRGDTRLGGGNAATVASTGVRGKITGNFSLDIGALATINTFMFLSSPENDWTGNTTINARNTGTANQFRNGDNEVIPHGPGKGNVTINGNTSTGTITWDLSGFSETLNGLLSAGNLAGCTIINNGATPSTLTVGDYDQTATYGGTIQNGTGGINFTKIGGGRQTLSGANTYTGITTISNGTLALSGAGSIASSSQIIVTGLENPNPTLDVSEVTGGFTYGSMIDITDGTLVIRNTVAPGIAGLNLSDARVRVMGLGSVPIVAEVTSLATGTESNKIDIGSIGTVPSYPATFTIIKYTGAIGGAGFNFELGNVPTSSTVGYVTNNEANSSIDIVLLDGPKPLTWTGLLGPAWDIDTTVNWRAFGLTPSVYLDVDSAIFDDSGASGTVDLTTTLQPGAVLVNNDLQTYTFTGAGKISGPAALTKDGPGTLIIANNGTNDFFGTLSVNTGTVQVGNGGTSGNLGAGSVVNNGHLSFNRSDNITVANPIAGGGTLEQNGAGILTLAGDNSFSGAVLVAQSTLKPGRGNALGTADGVTTVAPGATLDVNGQNITSEPVVVSGDGVGGNGAIVNSGADQQSALRNVTLAGDVVFGGAQRWDIRNTGGTASLLSGGQAFRITKIGPNAVSLVNVGVDAALGDVDVQQGIFRVEAGTSGLGDIFNSLTVHGGATLALFNLNPNPLNKMIFLSDGATVMHENGLSMVGGAITLEGANTFNVSNGGTNPSLLLSGPTDGPGTLLKTGTGPLVIDISSAVRHTGPTLVNAGSLLVNGTIESSPVTVAGGTLGGAGSVLSPVIIETNGQLAPGGLGSAIGTLAFENEVTLGGTTVMDINKSGGAFTADNIQGFSILTFGGRLQLNLAGEALADGDQIQLFAYGSASGAFAAVVPATPGPGLTWDTSMLTIDGTLRVVAPTVFEFGSVAVVGGDVVFNGGGGPASVEYRVLTSTDVTLPAANWQPVATNVFDANGNFNFALPINPATSQRFYILSY